VPDFFRTRKWDLVGLRNIWFAISLLLILPGLYFWAARGLNYGIDFTGGGLLTYQLKEPVAAAREVAVVERARQAVARTGIEVRLQVAGDALRKDQLLVRTRIAKEEREAAGQVLENQKLAIGAELAKAFPGCIFILLWVWLRYAGAQWGGTALVALAHDVLLLLGVFALTQREINSPFVAAALTVVGYSVHDTIVIFDRIRENLRLRRGDTFAGTANLSLLETMPRSINTVFTTDLVLIAVYVFGGASLRDFTFAMIVGITSGAYSSIFTASQLLVVLKNREERAIARRRRRAGRPAQAPVRPLPQPATPSAVPTRPRVESPPAGKTPATDTLGKGKQKTEPETVAPRQRRRSVPRSARRKLKASGKRKKRF